MKFAHNLFAKFGFYTRKSEPVMDVFELRLERSRTRDARRVCIPCLFKTRLKRRVA